MIRIENKRTYRGAGVYIGGPSSLGNPFQIGAHGEREDVIRFYRRWLWDRILEQGDAYAELKRLARLAKQGDLTLICRRKRPDRQIACYGAVIKRAVEYVSSIDG